MLVMFVVNHLCDGAYLFEMKRLLLNLIGYSLGKGVIEGVEKNTLLGIFSGGLSNTSAGITAAILFGFIIAIIFKPKEKK